MAVTLQVTDGTTTIDFTSTAGPQLLENALPTFAIPTGDGTEPAYIIESLPVLIHITSGNNLAATMQDFHALQVAAAEYHADVTYETPVWFHRKLTDETGAVRYLVRSMQFTPNDDFGGPLDAAPILTDGRTGMLTIEHHPYGERTSAVAVSTGTNLSVLGGNYAYTTVVGDVPARLYYARLYGGDSVTFEKAWMGFRSASKCTGTVANFEPLWELELGAVNNIIASTQNDATASPGGGGANYVQAIIGAETWTNIVAIEVDDVDGGNPDAFNGAFLVLLRAKVDTGTEQVKLKHRLVESNGPAKFNQVVDISATSWTLYNLGIVTFPTRNRRAFPIALKDASHDRSDLLELWGRDKPGDTGATLDADCFVLIPVDEYFLYIHNTAIDSVSESWMAIAPDGEAAGNTLGTTGSDYWYESSPTQAIGAGIPVGDGRMYICVAKASDAAPAYNDDIDVGLSWYPRWISYRGAE